MLEQLDDSAPHGDPQWPGVLRPQLWVESGWPVCPPGWLVSNHLSGLSAGVGSEGLASTPSLGSVWGSQTVQLYKLTALSS